MLLPLLLLADCVPQETLDKAAAPGGSAAAGGAAGNAATVPLAAVQTANLTGLYEGGAEARRNQMCVIDRGSGDARFGLVVWGAGENGCSGSGAAVRQGDALRLTMSGDEACTIQARIEGTRVTFPAQLPPGCSYYCGRGAALAGVTLNKTGGTAEDAMRAVDLVGDRLCAGIR